MDDLISRQAALNVLSRGDGCGASCHRAIKALPSAQPESKTGKWIEKEVYETRRKEEMQVAKCSNCGKYLTTPYIYSFNHYSFCPNCGAKLENTDEQED